jgi:uncharacterized membrane protein
MKTKVESRAKVVRERRQLGRLEMLMDVVFALVIWRVISFLPKPSREELAWNSLGPFLLDHLEGFVGVLIGMVLVVIYWSQNNTLFGNLERTDGRHTTISISQIFFLLIYLYAIRIGADFEGDPAALALQSLTLALAGITAVAGWSYAIKNRRLISAELSEEEARGRQFGILAEPITALITLPCAFVGSVAWELAWLSYPLVALVLKRRQSVSPVGDEGQGE